MLILAASSCTNEIHRGKSLGHRSKIRNQNPSENEYWEDFDSCFCFRLFDEEILDCFFSCLCGEEAVKRIGAGTTREHNKKSHTKKKRLDRNLTGIIFFDPKPYTL